MHPVPYGRQKFRQIKHLRAPNPILAAIPRNPTSGKMQSEPRRQNDMLSAIMSESDAQIAVRIAGAILAGSMPVFLGCKQLLGPLNRLGVHHQEPFITITGVESELDASPIFPGERELWNEESLAREDAKLAAWLPMIQPAVLEACRAIVRRFGEDG